MPTFVARGVTTFAMVVSALDAGKDADHRNRHQDQNEAEQIEVSGVRQHAVNQNSRDNREHAAKEQRRLQRRLVDEHLAEDCRDRENRTTEQPA